MGTPRETIRIVEENGENRLVQPSTREDVTEKWSSFQMTFTNDTGCGWFYFKRIVHRCGTRDVKIYSDFEKAPAKEKELAYLAEQ